MFSTLIPVILHVGLCCEELFGKDDDYPRLGFPFANSYKVYFSPTGYPRIEWLDFTYPGKVTMVSAAGRMPKGCYTCGYTADQHSGAPRITVVLADDCRVVVTDSAGYYDASFLTGITITSDYRTFYMPLWGGGEDQYTSD
ncbi:hypothetical protein FOL47_003719 [Perkinsus chesapeaki]|uniref:Uncharacterized protein n=1 Tax=Perkinsus chesapeaki TaxID=330153 RepID=A0A7J6M6C7_PERCH|nr:hypothetical protein FOL47_003719 [Perkinsus chesapeaki]